MEMATKKHQMAASLSPEPSQDAQITNWNKCIICQTDTDENLQCPAESRRTDQGAGYITFSENLARFHELDSIPVTLDIRRLDEGKGVRTTLEERHAKWHKSCRIKFNTTKLQRAEKRECPDPEKPHLNERLIAKLSAGDMVAQDVLYHARCLAALYKKASTAEHAEDKEEKMKLILANFPDLKAYKEGRDILLAFDEDIGSALTKVCEKEYDDEAITLAKAAQIVRRYMLEKNASFTGSFDSECQTQSVPQTLLALVAMIHEGPSIKSQSGSSGNVFSQATLSVAQLLQYNSSVRRGSESSGVRHNKARETPLAIYVGATIHEKTRKRQLVDKMFKLGLSISYDRVMEISTGQGNRACKQYEQEKTVCPRNLRLGLNTKGAIDNIDHNPSSTTAMDSFHGTGISLFQQVTESNPGTVRPDFCPLEVSTSKKVSELPDCYTSVPPVMYKRKERLTVPKIEGSLTRDGQLVEQALLKETRWLESVDGTNLVDVSGDSNVSWAAYHASHQQEQGITPDISVLLPLFQEQSKSTAMMRHSMDVIQQAVEHVNPGQVPVITVDQPLFAICKEIQWTWPEKYGEAKFVMVLGGLHTEMATMKVLGDWLEDSGWVEALVQAKVASPGTADSFLKAAHVTRTRHVHQVTACCLHILMKKAYLQYAEMKPDPDDVKTFEQWCDERSTESVQFYFWCTTLRLELLLMTYVRSLRESDFDLYVEILSKLIPWFFALDHVNYARWASVHVRDMISLEHMHPEVVEDFRNGGFTVRKSQRPFSAMAIDQAHEQNNATLKEDGGAVGLTQNPEAFRRWSVAGPEMARMIAEFESSVEAMESKQSKEMRHLEQTASIQKTFVTQVCSLVEVITDMGNPFIEESQELICLDTHDIMDEEAAKSVRQAEELGVQQYQSFVEERLVNGSKPLSDRITKNKLQLFGQPPARGKSQSTSKLQSLKSDCSLFSRLYIACQSRDGDLNEFFRHENQRCPPSLSQDGKLRQGKKSDLLDCLTSSVECSIDAPDSDAIILDGAALVNMLKPVVCTTFNDYADKVFLPYIEKQLERADRVDIVWDQYLENSLKSETRKRRGKGIRRRVQGTTTYLATGSSF
ncbi:uncharacterized protein LOC123516404 [Portunus trituberculatus]|uniref:uncharacterized protein LOC123516404 n=1 Tax=Portunus trituberculatus TaxID=210409 RepID=UPI001E1CB728|nr:uncharacterized protein LOC123516404 [Portunus trituberculatus]